MTGAADIISAAMQGAVTDGPVCGPATLTTLLSGIADPFGALSDHDKGNEIFDAFYSDLPFIKLAQHANKALTPADHEQLVQLLRWIIAELRGWRATDDPRGYKLVGILVATQACDWKNALWDMIPADIETNAELTGRLKALVRSLAVTFSSRDPDHTPLWEREAVDMLKAAEAQDDWAAIGNAWQPFSHAIFPDVAQTQAVRCLYRCGPAHLADALANLNQTAAGMTAAFALSTKQRLELAVASQNGYVQFCCLHQTLSEHRRPTQGLSTDEEELITKLLLMVANDEPKWMGWMKYFNAYPLRYPALQKPLGIALADAPNTAIEPYVNSIKLYPKQDPTDAGRAAVAACLEAFRSKASSARRADLWTIAHKRWSEWEFNRAEENQHLLRINWSEIDYAIVGYACECLDSGERNNVMKLLLDRLQTLDQEWHESFTHIVTAWNRVLSLHQPYAHAEHGVPAGDDWDNVRKQYLPFDPKQNEYVTMKFRLG